MKYVDEYRSPEAVRRCAKAIEDTLTRPWVLMEVCGGQTHAIVRFGIDALLPEALELVHGPGCPVCVTPMAMIDAACEVAGRTGVIFCSFGDMLRVPGTRTDLLSVKAQGGDVRVVYSPLDAVEVARKNPDREVVFFAVGFETTAPANAMAVLQASRLGLENFSVIVSHVLVPPAMSAILGASDNRVQGFLAAGHVCTVMGMAQYTPLAEAHQVPIVVTGFEPLDILEGVLMCVRQLESGRHEVENQYARAVRRSGNLSAQAIIEAVFEVVPRQWRGLGTLEASGLALKAAFDRFDALSRFELTGSGVDEGPGQCIAGLVLRGVKKPGECEAFGVACTPERPLGAPMVSSEGACAAYYRYRGPKEVR